VPEYVDRSIANLYPRDLTKRDSFIGDHPNPQFALIDFQGRSSDDNVPKMGESKEKQPERSENNRPTTPI